MTMEEPEYIQRLRKSKAFAEKTALQCELALINTRGVDRLTGLSAHEHRVRAMSHLFPSRIHHPWRDRLFSGYDRCRRERRKEFMNLGASNSTKTSSTSDLLLELWFECPEATSIYITSPYESATETGLWARVLEQFQEAKDYNPELPGKVKLSENKIVSYENNPLSFIQVVTIDQVGKLVGRKAKNFNVGMMIIAADELPEFKRNGEALIRVMNNLISVPNMMLIGAGNFASTSDGLGQFAEPDLPGGYSALRKEEHHEWISRRGGLVYRYDGDRSPGLEDPKKFFFLPTADYRDHLAATSGGVMSAEFWRYWHSFPLTATEEFTVTNISRVRSGKCLLEFQWNHEALTLGSHCDPGFGGDAAVVQDWRFGIAQTDDGSGLQVFEAWGSPIVIPVDVTSKLTAEEQIVTWHQKHCEHLGIPEENVSFDGSMRASIVQSYGKWSTRVVAIDSLGTGTDRPVTVLKEAGKEKVAVAKEKFANFITEMWMAVASLIISGQIRGLGATLETTVRQLCGRQWAWNGKRKQVETKRDYKKKNGGRSPNEADALVGGVEMARRRGLRLNGVSLANGGSMNLLLNLIKEREAQALVKQLTGETAPLQSGQLHGMNRPNRSRSSGKLNR